VANPKRKNCPLKAGYERFDAVSFLSTTQYDFHPSASASSHRLVAPA
jgi:hypothetical protein